MNMNRISKMHINFLLCLKFIIYLLQLLLIIHQNEPKKINLNELFDDIYKQHFLFLRDHLATQFLFVISKDSKNYNLFKYLENINNHDTKIEEKVVLLAKEGGQLKYHVPFDYKEFFELIKSKDKKLFFTSTKLLKTYRMVQAENIKPILEPNCFDNFKFPEKLIKLKTVFNKIKNIDKKILKKYKELKIDIQENKCFRTVSMKTLYDDVIVETLMHKYSTGNESSELSFVINLYSDLKSIFDNSFSKIKIYDNKRIWMENYLMKVLECLRAKDIIFEIPSFEHYPDFFATLFPYKCVDLQYKMFYSAEIVRGGVSFLEIMNNPNFIRFLNVKKIEIIKKYLPSIFFIDFYVYEEV